MVSRDVLKIPPRPRLASLPAVHPYVAAVAPACVDVVRIAIDGPHPWSPSRLWEPAHVADVAGGLDLVHVHFGYDHLEAASLTAWTAALRAAGIVLVVTVHDLRNPHHDEPGRHEASLGVLLAAADEVITLTQGAAGEVWAGWGRAATVLAHPSLGITRPGRAGEAGVVGVHLKSLRRNVREPVALVRAVAQGARRSGGVTRVELHDDVAAGEVGRELAGLTGIELRVHARRTDAELDEDLAALHACVLPYAFGTHSGWLEQCRDLGTRIVAPSCGYYAQQWDDVVGYRNDESAGLDADSLADAVEQALATPPPAPADPGWRARQREEIRAGHAEVYRRALAGQR